MRRVVNEEEREALILYLSSLPERILSIHGIENLTEFVLHDICHERSFGVDRAAFFVDNPDFNHMKGVSGFCKEESYPDWNEMWTDPRSFSLYMQSAPFNQKVRKFIGSSAKKSRKNDKELLKSVTGELEFENPSISMWNMKHNNHGFLVFEGDDEANKLDRHFVNTLHLLAFCPIF